MTLTFLILAGQVKVKGQLGEMAKCIEDGDKKIADMGRMFFAELATKDNAIYNQFVDMFSVLSADEGLDEEAFRRILRFLSGFIEKVRRRRMATVSLFSGADFNIRTNMRSNSRQSWLQGYRDAARKGTGMMLRLHLVCCSTKTKRSRRLSVRASSWFRRKRRDLATVVFD